jgi:hypothetical protein
MKFEPKTEAQIREENLVDGGFYRFTVLRTTQKVNKDNETYFSLKVRIKVGEKERIIFDNIKFSGKMMYKAKHFCDATGLIEQYNDGEIMPSDMDGREGELELIQTTNKETGEVQNFVRDYIVPKIEEKAEKFDDDDIKF